MTYDEFCNAVLALLPDASFGTDNDGQIVIYSGYKVETNSSLYGSDQTVTLIDEENN